MTRSPIHTQKLITQQLRRNDDDDNIIVTPLSPRRDEQYSGSCELLSSLYYPMFYYFYIIHDVFYYHRYPIGLYIGICICFIIGSRRTDEKNFILLLFIFILIFWTLRHIHSNTIAASCDCITNWIVIPVLMEKLYSHVNFCFIYFQ